MERKSYGLLLSEYRRQLFEVVLPFWLERGIDREHGGYFTCFNNDGSELLQEHKFTWSQGRFVWMLARLFRDYEGRVSEAQRARFLELARSGAEFLMEHARLPSGHCAFILDRRGRPILLDGAGQGRQAGTGEDYDLSIYADFFVIYGLGEYARAAQDERALEFALELYADVHRRLETGRYRTDPYPIPAGYQVHGEPMILLETSQELADAAEELGRRQRAIGLRRVAHRCSHRIMDLFRRPREQAVLEMLGADNQPRETLLGRFINPGHTIEDMWFLMHWALRTGDEQLFADAAETMRWALEKGWDREYGGLFLFRDKHGGEPAGEVPPELADHEMVRKVRGDWASKLWWPHSEALYALPLAIEDMERPWMDEWFQRVQDYTFRTFPNPDRSVGEWIQIRDRQGHPDPRIVALPVKDPFHIVRALALAIPVLERLAARELERD